MYLGSDHCLPPLPPPPWSELPSCLTRTMAIVFYLVSLPVSPLPGIQAIFTEWLEWSLQNLPQNKPLLWSKPSTGSLLSLHNPWIADHCLQGHSSSGSAYLSDPISCLVLLHLVLSSIFPVVLPPQGLCVLDPFSLTCFSSRHPQVRSDTWFILQMHPFWIAFSSLPCIRSSCIAYSHLICLQSINHHLIRYIFTCSHRIPFLCCLSLTCKLPENRDFINVSNVSLAPYTALHIGYGTEYIWVNTWMRSRHGEKDWESGSRGLGSCEQIVLRLGDDKERK